MKENPDMDSYASDSYIEELLNSYIDGELTARQQSEVERLLGQDAKIAERLRQLERCKMLVGSLPTAEAPYEILEDIRASLEKRTLLGEQTSDFDQRAGARHLLVRKVLAAAAMIGLVAVLATTIYTIVAPETAAPGPVAVEGGKRPGEIEVVEPKLSVVAAEFHGRLELKTSAFFEVDASISRAVEDNGLSDSTGPARHRDKSVYSISCGRDGLNLLLADLGNIWDKFNSATLFIDTEVFGEHVVVNAVTAEQIGEIAGQDTFERRIEVANDFAVLNTMAERLPGKQILAAIDGGRRSLITIPKPVLTWNQKTTKKPVDRGEDKQNVHLTIVVVGSE